MKLLLDEMFSVGVAQVLRQRGRDVICVTERSELRGRADAELLSIMANEGRVIVTNNARDFARLAGQMAAAGNDHAGVLLTSDRAVPRSRRSTGRFVAIVDEFLHQAPGDMRNEVRWLP